MGAAGVREQRQAPRVAARRQDRDLQHRRGESPEGIQGRPDGGAGTGRAPAGAPDRRVLQHGAYPAVGGDLRRVDSRLVRNLVIRGLIPFVLALAAAAAAPDGHTLILSAASHTINGSLYAKLPYDPIADFAGVAHIGTVEYVLMVSAGLAARTVAEFVDYARANPGKLNYATAGNGSATHLSMAYFAGLAGIDLVHVPYKATNEAVNEVLAGRSHAVIAANIGALGFVRDARVR